jgi:hypothetical protein
LKKASELIDKAFNDELFHIDYSDHLFATGERSVDYSAYWIELDENHSIILDFIDFGFDSFSIIHDKHVHLFQR